MKKTEGLGRWWVDVVIEWLHDWMDEWMTFQLFVKALREGEDGRS